MRRREFIGLLGGAAVWPQAVHAQPAQIRHLGALFVVAEPQAAGWAAALKEGLQKAGWTEGQNLHINLRFGWSDPDRIKRYADELVALKPDVIMVQGVVGAAILQRATKIIPVVFAQVQDPVGGGFVTSLSRPEANLTGFTDFEYSIATKWMQLLRDIAPHVTRALILINPDNRARWNDYMDAIEGHASSLGLRPVPAGVHDAGEIERAAAAFVQEPNGGMIVLPDATTSVHSGLIMDLAARHRLPAVFSNASFARSGALLTYGSTVVDQYRGAATYIDRILRGAKPGELPVQAIERFEMVINRKTARTLNLEVSPTLLARADEVIE